MTTPRPCPQALTEGTDAIVDLATEHPGTESGRFVDRTGDTEGMSGILRSQHCGGG